MGPQRGDRCRASAATGRYDGDGFSGGFRVHWGGSCDSAMPYEPGSTQCRVLIDCKAQIETMLLTLSRIEHSEAIRSQLMEVHQELEALHDQHRRREAAVA